MPYTWMYRMCLIRSFLSISKHSHCLIYYYTVPNLLPACTECFSSARSSPSQSDSHCLIYLFLRQGAWSSASPQDPSSVPRTCPLALEARILELEWALTLLKFTFLDPSLGELGQVRRHATHSSFTVARHRRDSDLQMVTEHVSTLHDPGPTVLIALTTDKGLERLPRLRLSVE